MNEKLISLEEFWSLRKQFPIVDARSEGEFLQSHIPNAFNIPILSNEERIIVGTLYKEKGSLEATLKGFELVGPRFHAIQKDALKKFPLGKIIVYCWRGGMRSQILSWLLSMIGFEVYRLDGGYKTYRAFTFEEVRKNWKLLLLGGKTGVGKTKLLQKLRELGEQILDLEDLANHKGSAFGAIGQKPQPSVEQFENLMAEELRLNDPDKVIWIENESRRIGRIIINDQFFELMSKSPLIDIRKSEEERIQLIEEEYSFLPKEELIAAVNRLKKKLGGLRTTEAIEDIINGNHQSWIANLLIYYDKTYQFDLERHDSNSVKVLDLTGIDLLESCQFLLKTKNQFDGKLTNSTH
ncbi:tRNA 2-selenouridine(34) synthase MnmH [Algoriphagus sp.]|uniref:tRNA 2-selenouridine(34) synthase MnmH n=1 Tax=Algoriphagus sp. TaxID=1872435 RepID=UPI0025F1C393|nr:tRNA 2-selenouridine(34) synthase MnmH [Algoriphagus sp.]